MIVVLLADLGWIVYLCVKLRHIRTHPQKYDAIPGYEQYRSSSWYWPAKKEHRKGDPPDLATNIAATGLVCIVLAFFVSTTAVYYLSAPGGEDIVKFVGAGAWMLSSYALIGAYSILLAFYLPLFLKTPKAISFSLFHICPKSTRSAAWEKMTLYVLIATVALLPLRVSSLCNTGYADREKIVYRPFGSVREQTIYYEEVRDVIVEQEGGGTVHCYLVDRQGERFDLNGRYTFLAPSDGEGMAPFLRLLPETLSDKIDRQTRS